MRIGALVLGGVGQAKGGGIDQFGVQAVPESGGFVARRGQGHAQAAEGVDGQSLACLAVSAGAVINPAPVVQGEEGLNLANNLAAGAVGLEHLVEEAKESAAHAKDALAAVGPFVGL